MSWIEQHKQAGSRRPVAKWVWLCYGKGLRSFRLGREEAGLFGYQSQPFSIGKVHNHGWGVCRCAGVRLGGVCRREDHAKNTLARWRRRPVNRGGEGKKDPAMDASRWLCPARPRMTRSREHGYERNGRNCHGDFELYRQTHCFNYTRKQQA